MACDQEAKDPVTIFVVSFLGGLGIDRFVLDKQYWVWLLH